MGKPPLTAGEIALVDQLAAGMNDQVAVLARAIRMGDASDGDAQNLANFIAYLTETYAAPHLAALAIAAIRQIPAGE